VRAQAAILIMLSGLPSLAAANSPAECMAGLREILREADFSGPLVCSRRDATFEFVGRTAGSGFSIYNYDYSYDPPGGSNVMHGGQRILVFRGKRYLGQYGLWSRSAVTAHVSGTRLVLQSNETKQRVVLDFSRTPPKEVFLAGEYHSFFR
jgi:hypothetical protein